MIITQNTTIASGQTLNITDNLQIASGVVLKIEAGATINGGTIQVFGFLDVQGTAGDRVNINGTSIIFSQNYQEPGRIKIDYANWNQGSFLPATGNGSYGAFNISNTVLNQLGQFYISYPTADSSMNGNIFLNTGEISLLNSSANIDISNNVFLAANTEGKIVDYANYGKQINIHHNAFLGTGTALEVALGYSSASMNALNNWFGTTDANVISGRILDRADDLNRSSLIPYQPYLTSPDQVSPANGWFKLGTAGDDTLTSDLRDTGQYLVGGGGRDNFVVHSVMDKVVLNGLNSGATIYADNTDFSLNLGSNFGDTLVLRGSSHIGSGKDFNFLSGVGNDKIYAYGDYNTLIGGSGNDTLFSYGHNNALYGGVGNDSYVVNSQDVHIYEDLGQFGGKDTVYADNVDFSISISGPNVETLVILSSNHVGAGSDRSDQITAYGANDTIYGGDGDDTLANFGSGGTMFGGGGNDIFVVIDRSTLVQESINEGSDTIYADGIDFSLSDAANVESLVLRGNNHVGAGTNGSDLLISQGISNQLFGGGGNDTFSFTPSHGVTQILDFDARPSEHDVAAFSTTQFANFAAVQSHLSQVGGDAVITAADGTGDTFILKNVVAANLHASDFLFV